MSMVCTACCTVAKKTINAGSCAVVRHTNFVPLYNLQGLVHALVLSFIGTQTHLYTISACDWTIQ